MENETKGDRIEGVCRKRLLTDPNPKESFFTESPESTVSSDSSSDRFEKKTRELPNLSDCHGCGMRINYTNPRERLQPLESMWRVVLLCKRCSKRVKSSELCPYCFTAVVDGEDCFDCRDCRHSIHRECVAKHGPGLGFLVCVDCWVPDAVANSIRARKRKCRRKNRESCERAADLPPESRVSVLETNGTQLSGEEVERKAVVAKKAVELAKGMLSVVASRKTPSSPQKKVVDDVELAYMLHRAINSSPRTSRYACLVGSYSREDAPITCYSRRRGRKKSSLMNSSSSDVPLIFYSRRRFRKGGMRNLGSDAPLLCYSRKGGKRNSALGVPLVCYSRRRSGSRVCSHVRECELICKPSERIDKDVSTSSAAYAENNLNGKECKESDGERFSKEESHRYLLKYRRVGKGTPRPSVFVKDPDCGSCMDSANLNTKSMSDPMSYGNGNECHEICEKCNETANRFLLKYKRSVRSNPKFSCKIKEFSRPLSSNHSLESTSLADTNFQPSYKDPACLGPCPSQLLMSGNEVLYLRFGGTHLSVVMMGHDVEFDSSPVTSLQDLELHPPLNLQKAQENSWASNDDYFSSDLNKNIGFREYALLTLQVSFIGYGKARGTKNARAYEETKQTRRTIEPYKPAKPSKKAQETLKPSKICPLYLF
ncbi:hypothetical protein OSB04_030872 [Centaurea solstitialis]|uniref:Uncharacterized protein n=1 Tax=Centaurea solstitialis TaxID=347529 RepID=A0AA38S7V7_9ASTR|nr:hypothetical protein OSB04_030872 [Centaurea solstitialis]